jgi:hypothetical protein
MRKEAAGAAGGMGRVAPFWAIALAPLWMINRTGRGVGAQEDCGRAAAAGAWRSPGPPGPGHRTPPPIPAMILA